MSGRGGADSTDGNLALELRSSPKPVTPTGTVIVPQATEFGVAGTEFKYGGLKGAIIGDDYNRDMQGAAGLQKYDEMRRGDAGVRSILSIIKAPIIRAKPEIRLPKFKNDALKEEKSASEEMQEWLQWALLDDDAMQEDWDFYIRNQLLCVDFGFSVSEIVWQVDDDDKYRPLRLAPRLPRTVYKWVVDRNGRLIGIIQRAHDPTDGKLKEFSIPGDYLMVTTFDREGDNFQGFGLLRSAYKHYYYKDQLYHIDMVRIDRFGVGIPMAELEEGFSTRLNELSKLEQILEGIRSNHKAYIISPPKAKISILTPGAGTAGGAEGIQNAINHHDTMMARNALAHFMTMGQEKHGSWSLGVSFIDLFMSAEEALAYTLGSVMKRRVLRPMCELNFPQTTTKGQLVKYPWLAFTDIGRVDIVALSDALSKLGAGGFITDDDTLEEFIRTKGNLPPLPPDRNRAAREKAMKDAGLNPAIPPQMQVPPPDPNAPPAPPPAALSMFQLDGHGRGHRQPTAFERTILALHEIPSRLDFEEEQLARKISQVRLAQLSYLANLVAKKDARQDTAAHTDIRPENIKLPARLQTEVETLIRASQDSMAAFGSQQVRLELVRQGAPLQLDGIAGLDPFDGDPMMLDKGASATRLTARSHLVSSAKAAAKKLNEGWIQRVLEAALRLRKVGLTGSKLESEIVSILSPDAKVNTVPAAQEEIREAFGVGRAVEAGRHADMIEKVVQSAILDRTTCRECEMVDGEEMAMGSQRQIRLNPPYIACQGKEKCRCVQLYLYAGRRERSNIAASSNSPPPVDTEVIAAAIRESMQLVTGTFRAEMESILQPMQRELSELRSAAANPKPEPSRHTDFVRDPITGRLAGFVERVELAYHPGQPRIPRGSSGGGEWTSGRSGARAGAADPAETFYASPADAVRSLENGHPVTVAREDLRGVLDRAATSAVPDIDLTKITVEDTPLFAGGLGRARDTMPQIPKENRAAFGAYLTERKVAVQAEFVNPLSLLPIQNEINAGKVGQKLAEYDKGKKTLTAIYASQDNYVLDGHHRWAVAASVAFENPSIAVRQPVARIMTDHSQALQIMEDFMAIHGIKKQGLAEFASWRNIDESDIDFTEYELAYNPSQPRVPAGQSGGGKWTTGGRGILPGMAREDQPREVAGMGGALAAPEALSTGKITGTADMDSGGINEISRVTIEHEGNKIEALFKPEDGEKWDDSDISGQGESNRGSSADFEYTGGGGAIRDSIQNRDVSLAQREVAAYEVSQLLGMNNVPPTAIRTIDGRRGMVQQFMPETRAFAEVGGGRPQDHLEMAVLDVVIGNTDRHQYNGLVDPNGKMWSIDHGYTFPSSNDEFHNQITNTSTLRSFAGELDGQATRIQKRLDSTDWNGFAHKHGLDVSETESMHARINYLSEQMRGNGAIGVADTLTALQKHQVE